MPALLIFFIRLFVNESEKWQEERQRGATDHWATWDLLAVFLGCGSALGIVWLWTPAKTHPLPIYMPVMDTLLLLPVTLLGYVFPVWQYWGRASQLGGTYARSTIMKRMLLGAGLSGVALIGTWASIHWAPKWVGELVHDYSLHAKDWTQICTSSGAAIALLLTGLAGNYLKRCVTYAIICLTTVATALLSTASSRFIFQSFSPIRFVLLRQSGSCYGAGFLL